MEFINELPMQLQLLCIQRQMEQGNKPNVHLYISDGATEGNFDYDETPEGNSFWCEVRNLEIENYKNF